MSSEQENTLPEYDLPGLSGNPVDQLGQFDTIVEQAIDKGVINDVPTSEQETFNYKKQQLRLQTIASRLHLLGYIRRKIALRRIKHRLDDIKAAVYEFQKDAGLVEDGWVGDKTWFSLQELFSFETKLSQKWFNSDGTIYDRNKRALHRAIQLRMWSLGLMNRRPKKNFSLLEGKDLEKLKKITSIFLLDKPPSFGFNYDTLSILFDQDRLSNAIARRSSRSKMSFLLNTNKKLRNKRLAERFIVNCAKIELWLLGYDVKIDGKNNYNISLNSDIYKALKLFYRDFKNLSTSKATQLAKTIKPVFFTEIAEVADKTDSYSNKDASQDIFQYFTSHQKVESAWSYVKERSLSLWDGLKRIWRWIKKIGRKVINFIKENIFKGFFRFVSKAYKITKTGFSQIAKSISTYVKGSLKGENYFIKYSKDMDTTAYYLNTSTENHTNTSELLIRQSKAFRIGCSIIGWVFKIFKKISTGFIGWTRLLMTFVKSYQEIRKLYLDFKSLALP